MPRRGLLQLVCGVAVIGSVLAAPVVPAAESHRLFVTAVGAALVDRGLAAPAPTGAAAGGFEVVPAPGVRFVANVAQSTTAPWIDSNVWRFKKGVRKVSYEKLGAGTAALAAAEAFTYDAEAILNPEPADVDELGKMLEFLKANAAPRGSEMVNIAVVDSQSPLLGEVLNLLARRNLLYKVVAKPDARADLTVQLGSREFPEADAANPSDFAAKIRGKLGDDKRLVRLYGTSTLIASLTGDGAKARLILLAYGGGNRRQPTGAQQGVRVRVLGRYKPTKLAAYEAPADATLVDVDNPGNATEFTLPSFRRIAIVDLAGLE